MATLTLANAAPNFSTDSPISFFTNVASRVLSQELSLNFNQIQIYPTNQYTPSVHRLLQVAANVYDAMTNSFYPSVFRPIFYMDPAGNVFICGYEPVASVTGPNDPQLSLPMDVSTLTTNLSAGTFTNVNVYGVPWIIGAKKGFPNFNEFSMESIIGINRRLQVTRPTINPSSGSPDFATFRTNQMYSMIITNWLGVECWNSYTNNYVPVSGNLTIVVRDNLSMTLTNDDGMTSVTTSDTLNNSVSITAPPYWPGSPLPWTADGQPSASSFDIPLLANVVMQLNPVYPFSDWWAYRFNAHEFLPTSPNPLFETDIPGFPFPHFGLLTTNRLQVFMLDGNHVIDYAHFAGPESVRDLNAEFFTDDIEGVWNTNASIVGVPIGIRNQIQVSRGGESPLEDGVWHPNPEAFPLGGTPPQQQAYFAAFFQPGNRAVAPGWGGFSEAMATNLQLSVIAPYMPARYTVQYITWQANDPLAHYIASDLNYTLPTGGPLNPGINTFNYGTQIPTLTDLNLGQLNDHFRIGLLGMSTWTE